MIIPRRIISVANHSKMARLRCKRTTNPYLGSVTTDKAQCRIS